MFSWLTWVHCNNPYTCCTLPMRDWNSLSVPLSNKTYTLYITYEGLKHVVNSEFFVHFNVVHYLWGIETIKHTQLSTFSGSLYITYEGLKLNYIDYCVTSKELFVVHYLWGIETLTVVSYRFLLILLYITYEGLKLRRNG